MQLTRREVLALSVGATVFGVAGLRAGGAVAAPEDVKKLMMEFAGGEPKTGRIVLTVPEIAENGNSVPVSFAVESPMTDKDYVSSVMLYADGNPVPTVASFTFTPMSGKAVATTRMRLAKTQNVIVVAKMSDGSSFTDTKQVKVTIGGCGG
jgi:sulfur-oxidizing protein SoxY